MKNILLVLLLSSICLFPISCKKYKRSKENCEGKVTLNVPFLADYNCTYSCELNKDSTLIIEFENIKDLRATSKGCDASTGGNAWCYFNVYLKGTEKTKVELIWPGCEGNSEYSIDNTALPTIQFGSYKFKMMKLFPTSEAMTSKPEKIDDYLIRLVVTD